MTPLEAPKAAKVAAIQAGKAPSSEKSARMPTIALLIYADARHRSQ
jgi:hypothetical protein